MLSEMLDPDPVSVRDTPTRMAESVAVRCVKHRRVRPLSAQSRRSYTSQNSPQSIGASRTKCRRVGHPMTVVQTLSDEELRTPEWRLAHRVSVFTTLNAATKTRFSISYQYLTQPH